MTKKIESSELQVSVRRPGQLSIISPRISPASLSRYHGGSSALGITALLHDDTEFSIREATYASTSVSISASAPCLPLERLLSRNHLFNTKSEASPPPLQSDSRASSPELPKSPSLLFSASTMSFSSSEITSTPIVDQSSTPATPLPLPPLFSEPKYVSVGECEAPQPPPPHLFNTESEASPPPPPPLLPSTPSLPTEPPFQQPSPPLHSSLLEEATPTPLPLPSLFSEPNSVSVVKCSAPPPPPPPMSIQEETSARNGQTILPPPAPLLNGLSKTSGNIPTPPSSTKAKLLLSRSSTRNQAQSRNTPLKPYHWLKLTRAMQGSIWAEAQKPEEASKAPEIDMSELESLFSASVPNSDHRGASGKTSRRGSVLKSGKVQLINLRRAYNCEIMLKKVKVPLSDLMNSVLALDELALDIDQVDNLIKFCPTKEEIELLKNYDGDKENLGRCEQFLLELMKVPRVESKLRVFSFKIQFWSQVYDLRNNLKIVESASEEVRSSIKLRRIMRTILSLGNALNHGTAKGSAVGFRLDSLSKLTETKAHDNKLTLMHYLCKVLAKNMPEVLDFQKDLVSLEAASKIQLKYLAEETQAINKGLEKVDQELTASKNDGDVSQHFCQTLEEFLSSAGVAVQSMASLYPGVGRNADALAFYFGEDPARCSFEQVVSTLLNFVRMFHKAHKENCQQLEFEKKKAQKEAEYQKAKLYGSEKELQNENAKASAAKMPRKLVCL